MTTSASFTLSLHDALPISQQPCRGGVADLMRVERDPRSHVRQQQRLGKCDRSVAESLGQAGQRQDRNEKHCGREDRKSTRLNSSHMSISYAVLCQKK